jgi:hypothetical protein
MKWKTVRLRYVLREVSGALASENQGKATGNACSDYRPVETQDITYTWRVDKSYLPQRRNENCTKSGLRKIGPACPRQLVSSRDDS